MPDTPSDPDYLARIKLHGNRPSNGGTYQRTIIGHASVNATFDVPLVGLSIEDNEAWGGETRLAGVLMALTAAEAYALGHELQTAARIADARLGLDPEDELAPW